LKLGNPLHGLGEVTEVTTENKKNHLFPKPFAILTIEKRIGL